MKGQNILFYEVNTMSLFSFIFFPRKLDEKRLYEIISDKLYDFSSLSKLPFFHQEHLDDFYNKMDDGMISGIYIHKEPYLKFKGNFHNKFYYLLSHHLYYYVDTIENTRKFVNKEIKIFDKSNMDMEILIESALEHYQLFTIIDENIKHGEFVEIYNEVLHDDWKFIWGPPRETIELSLNDVLSERTFNLSGSGWKKFVIYK